MRLSKEGLDFIKSHEGLVLRAYKDVAGIWTVGYGHTISARPGMVVTKDQAEELLRQDLVLPERTVNAGCYGIPLTQHQYDALVSFTYNVGSTAFSRSTLLRRLKAGDYDGAATQFLSWSMAGGKQVKGLLNRRAAERGLFLTKVETAT